MANNLFDDLLGEIKTASRGVPRFRCVRCQKEIAFVRQNQSHECGGKEYRVRWIASLREVDGEGKAQA